MKAVITTAGYGSRLFPATKNIQKELLPIIDKPTIHYVIEQYIEAGITDIIVVKNRKDTLLERYFQMEKGIKEYFKMKNKEHLIAQMEAFLNKCKVKFVQQDLRLPYGTARPMFSARKYIEDEPFLFQWGDVFYINDNPVKRATELFISEPDIDAILTAYDIAWENVGRTGVVKLKEGRQNEVELIVEHPKQEEAPSNIATSGPYLFTPKIFDYLNPAILNPRLGEFIIQDGIMGIINSGGKVKIAPTEGTYVSNGDPHEVLVAHVEIGLNRPDTREKFKKYLLEKVRNIQKE